MEESWSGISWNKKFRWRCCRKLEKVNIDLRYEKRDEGKEVKREILFVGNL